MTHSTPIHGGSDALGVPQWDFSTNSNAAGPCPHTLHALAHADATRYPDPGYAALRGQLADFHGVAQHRIVIGASGSELIARITAWVAQQVWPLPPLGEGGDGGNPHTHMEAATTPPSQVWLPPHHYADYAHAAQQHGLPRTSQMAQAGLIWLCAPTSPHGQALALPADWQQRPPQATTVLDCAYAPLQLSNTGIAPHLDKNTVWQIWTPNKALGLCGIRAAYAIAPFHADAADIARLQALAPSWPLGAHGVALLTSWCTPHTQQWLNAARATLRQWKDQQIALLTLHGWQVLPSETNFLIAQPQLPMGTPWNDWLIQLRQKDIKLRDCTSFGLPGHVRLCVHTPQAQQSLADAIAMLG